MLSLTRKADYTIMAMAELARRYPGRISARHLSETTQVPLPMLTNLLHQLLHRGLVKSLLGSKGGYSLARTADKISLMDLIAAVEGRFKLAACCEDEPLTDQEACDLATKCRIKGPVKRVHKNLQRFLSDVSLMEIAFDDVPSCGIYELGIQRGDQDLKIATGRK